MNQEKKQDIVDQAVALIKQLKDETEHPEAIILLSCIKKPGIEGFGVMTAVGAMVGCKHGFVEAIELACEDDDFASAILKVAKRLKAKRKEQPKNFEDQIKTRMGRTGHVEVIDLSGMMMGHSDEIMGKREAMMDDFTKGVDVLPNEKFAEYAKRKGFEIPPELKRITEIMDLLFNVKTRHNGN